MDDLKDWLALAHAPGLHAGQVQDWLAEGVPPCELARQSRSTLAALGLSVAAITALLQPDAAAIERDLAWLDGDARRSLVRWGTPDYPPLLATIPGRAADALCRG